MARPPVGPDALTRGQLLGGSGGRRGSVRAATERLIAVGYGLTYDAVVSGFPPYERLLEEIMTLVARSAPAGGVVTGIDSVAHLVDVAQNRWAGQGLALTFENRDIAAEPTPAEGAFDVIVSMHALYWHPKPDALLAACRRALKPGGHAIFLTYGRPARLMPTLRAVRAQGGLLESLRALRWLLPTAIFETLRHVERRYLSESDFRSALIAAGFEVLDIRETFLAGISRLAWTRAPR